MTPLKDIKAGDLITCRYKYADLDYRRGIGYVYDNGNGGLYVGVSCKDGGTRNLSLEEVGIVQKVKTQADWD